VAARPGGTYWAGVLLRYVCSAKHRPGEAAEQYRKEKGSTVYHRSHATKRVLSLGKVLLRCLTWLAGSAGYLSLKKLPAWRFP
jgi:hypothetical protein